MTTELLTTELPVATLTTAPVIPLAEATDVATCGNKACNLARLAAWGFDVPPAVVVTNAALEQFLDDSGLRESIAAMTSDLASTSSEEVARGAATARAAISASAVPRALRDAIAAASSALGDGPLMARSSAAGEDGRSTSFAGQLDSFGDLHAADEVIQAVVRVWASRWSDRALAYGCATGVTLDTMGVLLQRQVAARWSGVVFTEAPGDPAQMLMEFCDGPGDALVSGRINPGRITIARRDLRWTLMEPPERLTGQATPLASLVDDRPLGEIARVGLAIEQCFGGPQDVEWVIDESGRLWIVQARPITVARRPSPAASPASSADATPPTAGAPRVVWSNANVNENFPDPISPLLYSIASAGYYHYFRNLGRAYGISHRRLEAMEQPLRHIIGVHGGRMYYNLTSIHAVLRSAPCGDLLAASFDRFVGAESTDTSAIVPFVTRAANRASLALEIAGVAFQITQQYVSLERRVSHFERRVDAFAVATEPDRLPARSMAELLDQFRAFRHLRCHQWNDAALADAGAMVCYGVLQRLLARAFPEDDQQALHNSLLKALPDLVSGRPVLDLWALAAQVRGREDLTTLFESADDAGVLAVLDHDARFADFRQALARFQQQWGFRCSGELMLTTPSFQEDATPLVSLIRSYLAADGESPAEILQRQAAERLADTARVGRELRVRRLVPLVPRFVQRAVVLRILRWTQTCIGLRERARLKQALLYSRLRRLVLEIGARLTANDRLAKADDIFFLTADEIDEFLSGGAMFPDHLCALVELRRRAHIAISATTPPDSLTLGEGEYFSAGTPRQPSSPGSADLTGLGACGGHVTAPATVLSDVRESHRLRAGDVLVTRQTDPGWAPVFPLISGLVVERGGMLSHGAIIAREFGIPSVVGVRDATTRIAQGAVVTVDGDRGIVTVVGGTP